MKNNELRIGNYVQADGYYPYADIDGVNTDFVAIGAEAYSYEAIEPIPLTEEILLKCGFEKLKGKKNENTFMNADLNFGNPVLKLNDYTMLYTNGGYEYLFLDGFRLPCKHLHTLQNLYFALTGEELKLKA